MIGILVAMIFMFITICVVLRLFSKYVINAFIKRFVKISFIGQDGGRIGRYLIRQIRGL